jgi:hypothetical protein
MEETKPERLLPTRELRKRYGVVTRTLDRWLEAGILPPPIRINQNRYWKEGELEQREREGMTKHAVTGAGQARPRRGRPRKVAAAIEAAPPEAA